MMVNICFVNYWAQQIAPNCLAETKIAAVRFVKILLRTNGDNPGRVDGFMATVVMVADMGEVHRFRNARHLVDIAQEAIQVEVIADAAFVAFKVGHVHRIETNQGGPQANISFRQLVTRQETMLAKDLLQTLQSGKHCINRFIIGLLAGGEPGFIDAVIHIIVDPAVQLINLIAQLRRVVISCAAAQPIEGGIKHADDFRRLIADDGVLLLSHSTGTVTRPL